MKPISPRLHGAVDYAACAGMLAVPSLLDLNPGARSASYTLAAAYLGVSLLTDYPLALKRLIPFPMHGKIELASGPALLALPALLGGLGRGKEKAYFVALLAMVLGVYSLTDWNASPDA